MKSHTINPKKSAWLLGSFSQIKGAEAEAPGGIRREQRWSDFVQNLIYSNLLADIFKGPFFRFNIRGQWI